MECHTWRPLSEKAVSSKTYYKLPTSALLAAPRTPVTTYSWPAGAWALRGGEGRGRGHGFGDEETGAEKR